MWSNEYILYLFQDWCTIEKYNNDKQHLNCFFACFRYWMLPGTCLKRSGIHLKNIRYFKCFDDWTITVSCYFLWLVSSGLLVKPNSLFMNAPALVNQVKMKNSNQPCVQIRLYIVWFKIFNFKIHFCRWLIYK